MNANTLPTDTMPLTSTASGQLDHRRFLGPHVSVDMKPRHLYHVDSVIISSAPHPPCLLKKMALVIAEDPDGAGYTAELLQLIKENIGRLDHITPIAEIANDLESSGFHQNAKRILELWEMDYSEEGEKPVSFASIKGFSRFVNRVKFLGEPALGVFNEGTLGAQWKTPREQSLLIEFLDADRALFALIRPDPKKPGETIQRTADNLSHDELMKKLVQNGVRKWQI